MTIEEVFKEGLRLTREAMGLPKGNLDIKGTDIPVLKARTRTLTFPRKDRNTPSCSFCERSQRGTRHEAGGSEDPQAVEGHSR